MGEKKTVGAMNARFGDKNEVHELEDIWKCEVGVKQKRSNKQKRQCLQVHGESITTENIWRMGPQWKLRVPKGCEFYYKR